MATTEQLKKIFDVINVDNIITPADIEQVLTAIIKILADYKKQTELLNLETKSSANNIFQRINTALDTLVTQTDKKNENLKSQILTEVANIKKSVEEIKAIEIPEVVDGKDADEEVIVEKVLAQIPPPDTSFIQGFNDELDSLRKEIAKLREEGSKGGTKVIGGQSGIRLYVDGTKKSLIKNLNIKAGTNTTLSHTIVNGLDTITINSTGGGGTTSNLQTEAGENLLTQDGSNLIQE